MLKIVGMILVISGCVGASAGLCSEQKQRLETLKGIRILYENMKYYFDYQRATIPEILLKIADIKELPFSSLFRTIYKEIEVENRDFAGAWEDCIGKELSRMPLQKKDWKLILNFPICLRYMEGSSQAKALDELIREANQIIQKVEKEEQSNQKIIMSLGTALGIILSIILL